MSENQRFCRFCGEPGHNVRSCKPLAEAKKNIETFANRIPKLGREVLDKELPNSFLEGSLPSCSFTPNEAEYALGDFLPHYSRIRTDCVNEIRDVLLENGWVGVHDSLWKFLNDGVIVSVKKDQNQEISFFNSRVVLNPVDNRRGTETIMGVLSRLDYKISDYIQEKIEEPGENNYKTIWGYITGDTKQFSHNYRGYEGKEGEIVACFLKNTMQTLSGSSSRKQAPASAFFEIIVDYICKRSYAHIRPSDFVSFEGEFYDVSSPSFEVKFVQEELSLLSGLRNSPELQEGVEEIVSDAVKQVFLSSAKSFLGVRELGSRKNDTISLTRLNRFNSEHSTQGSLWSEKTTLGDFFQEPGAPSVIVDFYNRKLNFSSTKREEALKDFIKMAHTGGYYQAFSAGKVKSDSAFLYLGSNSFLEERSYSYSNNSESTWMPARSIAMNPHTTHRQGVSLSLAHVVNGLIEALANSKCVILEKR